MSLIDLGWNDYFEAQFHPYKEQNMFPARVVRENKNNYNLISREGESIGILPGKMLQESVETIRPVVGDWVVIDRYSEDSPSVIQAVLQRKTSVERKVAGVETKVQVIAANIDKIFLVTGLDDDFNISRIERYLTVIYDSGASPVIVLNKTDVCADLDSILSELETVAIGVPVVPVSALHANNIELIEEHLNPGETAALIGSSGVGKSTLINQLLGEEKMKVNYVSEEKSKGRHTTTHREMILLPNKSVLIDTPGMREVQLWSESDSLSQSFSDIEELSYNCKFDDCSHKTEPGCAVLQAIDDGQLDERRYQNYLKLEKEMAYINKRKDQFGRYLERKERKKFASVVKQAKKIGLRKRGR